MLGSLGGLSICMLGGDRRELELAQYLIREEVELRLVGFRDQPGLESANHYADPLEAVEGVAAVLGPMSNTDLKGRIMTRLDEGSPIDLTQIIPALPAGTPLFLGVAKPIIKQLAAQYGLRLVETAEIDEIAIYNSIPTAEGAIQLAMERLPVTIHGSRCLVVGFGRCGVTLARALDGLGAKVAITARRKSHLARAEEMGLSAIPLDRLFGFSEWEVIFNTVPALVLTKPFLRKLAASTLIIDLAAAPGGTDFEAAEELGIEAILALSLPGKVAPKTAGKILTQCLPRILEELLGRQSNEA